MYAVVGCSECQHLWLLSDPQTSDSATCPGCSKTHQTDSLKHLFESAERDPARQTRAALLAKRSGESAAFAELDHISKQEARLDEVGVDDREYLEGAGLDADEVAAAGEISSGGSRSRTEILRDAIRETDPSTEDAIIARAAESGVPETAAADLLEKLARQGEVTRGSSGYRLL